MLVANVPLVDTSPEAATELWPGTHRDTRTYRSDRPSQPGRIPDEWLAARRMEVPPVQVSQRKGSVLLRDIRLWHGGVPNSTGRPRVMLAMCYAATWYAATAITFAADAQPVIHALGVPVPAEFSPEPFDYLDPRFSGLHGPQMTFQGYASEKSPQPQTSGARA